MTCTNLQMASSKLFSSRIHIYSTVLTVYSCLQLTIIYVNFKFKIIFKRTNRYRYRDNFIQTSFPDIYKNLILQ